MKLRIIDYLNAVVHRAGFAVAIGALIFGAAAANASCRVPALGASNQTQMSHSKGAAKQDQKVDEASIVGLWHVIYTDSSGQFFLETLDTWHRDGTEIESANANPIEGNTCMGVWKKTSPNTVSLNHIGWNFDNAGNSAGYFTISESDTLAEDGQSYQGTFDFKVYDANGNVQFEVSGTLAATRINP